MSNIELVSCRSVSRHVWREDGGLGQPDWQAVALNASGLKRQESGIKSSSKSHSPEHASRVGDGGDGLIAKYLPLKFS